MFVQPVHTLVSCPNGHDIKVCALLEGRVCAVKGRPVRTLLTARWQSLYMASPNNNFGGSDIEGHLRFDNQSMCSA